MAFLSLPIAYSLLFGTLCSFLLLAVCFIRSRVTVEEEGGHKVNLSDSELKKRTDPGKSWAVAFKKKIHFLFNCSCQLVAIRKTCLQIFKISKDAIMNPGSDFVFSDKKLSCITLALSLYASSVGNWVLYIPPSIGAYYSWLGIIGFAGGCAGAQLCLILLVPYVKSSFFLDSNHDYKNNSCEKVETEKQGKNKMGIPEAGSVMEKDYSKVKNEFLLDVRNESNIKIKLEDMEEVIGTEKQDSQTETNITLPDEVTSKFQESTDISRISDNKINRNAYNEEMIFTASDYILYRYGNISHVVICINSMLLMWIGITAELTNIVLTMKLLTRNEMDTLSIVIPVSFFTLLYTTFGGLQASILTDKIQGILIAALCIIVTVSIGIHHQNTTQVWSVASSMSIESLIACLVFFFSVLPCEQFNQGTWQRVLSAKNTKDAKIALLISSLLVGITVMLLGIIGIFAKALSTRISSTSNDDTNNSVFFNLLLPLHETVLSLGAILALCLVCSSIDTLQNAFSALVANKLLRSKLSLNWSRLFSVLITISAIALSSLEFDTLKLYMVSNLLCSSMVMPHMLSISSRTTTSGFLCGCFVGVSTIFVCGWIFTKDFVKGLLFIYQEDSANIPYLYAFLFVPFMSAVATIFVSFVDKKFILKKNINTRTVNDKKETYQIDSTSCEIQNNIWKSKKLDEGGTIREAVQVEVLVECTEATEIGNESERDFH